MIWTKSSYTPMIIGRFRRREINGGDIAACLGCLFCCLIEDDLCGDVITVKSFLFILLESIC